MRGLTRRQGHIEPPELGDFLARAGVDTFGSRPAGVPIVRIVDPDLTR
jgi:hypothetical protein